MRDPTVPALSTPPTGRSLHGSPCEQSLVLLNTGDGKGKSTAAFGTVMRAVAMGWKVMVVQFLNAGTWQVGEEETARALGVDWYAIGDGFAWDSKDITRSQAIAGQAWDFATEMVSVGDYDLVVLDELTFPINWGWIDIDDVVRSLEERPPQVNIIVTGRDAPAGLIEVADTVTEMVKVKHAYDRGVIARRGLDF